MWIIVNIGCEAKGLRLCSGEFAIGVNQLAQHIIAHQPAPQHISAHIGHKAPFHLHDRHTRVWVSDADIRSARYLETSAKAHAMQCCDHGHGKFAPLHRNLLECSVYRDEERPILENTLQELGLDFEIVKDRIGMVTPRIVCMIINEACFVLKEGTADIAGVDRAMKLGTAYPRGPFEWADAIGIENVHHVLEAMQEESGEEKYKLAPLLKQYFYRRKKFYN